MNDYLQNPRFSVGLRSYNESDATIFFGRAREVDEIVKLVSAHRITLLFGQSGTGKTSISNAGVSVRLMQQGYKISNIRIRFFSPELSMADQIKAILIQQTYGELPPTNDLVQKSLHEVLAAVQQDHFKVLMIFDQFEELFVASDIQETNEFLYCLETLFEELTENVKFLFSIREDYLGQLLELKQFSSVTAKYFFRLKGFTRQSALEIITNVGQGMMLPEAAQATVDMLGKDKAIEIDPPMLQLVISELDRLREEQWLTGYLKVPGINVETVCSNFLNKILPNIPHADKILEQLFSLDGRRMFINLEQLRHDGAIPMESVYKLVDRHIIRKSMKNDTEYIELAHDVLVSPVRKAIQEIKLSAMKATLLAGSAKQYEYQVAITFASEDNNVAKPIAKKLRDKKVKVYYQGFDEGNAWGQNLRDYLEGIYSNAQFILMIISKHYASKVWTTHEREVAQASAFSKKGVLILPLRLDETVIPGLDPDTAYINYRDVTTKNIVNMLVAKTKATSGSKISE